MAKVDTYQHPELGQALRFLRARSGLSQARVADQVSARGGRLTPVWLSRIESAADRGDGPYPSVALLDRVLAVLGSSRDELERLLAERPWARVGEGAEWAAAAPAEAFAAAAPAGAPLPGAAARSPGAPTGAPPSGVVAPSPAAAGGAPSRSVVAPSSGAAAPPPGAAASSPRAGGPPDIAAEAAELGARYARLSRAAQLELLARARELS